jgi:hypothetical protein
MAQSLEMGRPLESVRSAVALIDKVPGKFRVYEQSPEMAKSAHGISPQQLEALLDCGLPHQISGGVPLLDELDLANASFHLGLPSARSMAFRGWAGSLRTISKARSATYSISFRAQCPRPGHTGYCSLTQPSQIASAIGLASTRFPPPEFSCEFTTGKPSVLLASPFRNLMESLGDIKYHLLPNELHEDIGFLEDSGLADCPLAAEFLVNAGAAHGMRVRKSFGIFASTPFSVPHFWAEVDVDGEWHAVDPHLLRMLGLRGLIEPGTWPAFRTLGGAVWRLADRDLPLALHNGSEVPCSMPTQRTTVDGGIR